MVAIKSSRVFAVQFMIVWYYLLCRSKLVRCRAGNIMWMRLEAALHTLLNFKSKGGIKNDDYYYQFDPDYRNIHFGHLGVY